MKKPEILYPCLLKCSLYATDDFWRGIFEDMAYGKCPYTIVLSRWYLYCHVKGKEFNYRIDPRQDPEILYQEMYHLLNHKAHILSEEQRNYVRNQWITPNQLNMNVNMKPQLVFMDEQQIIIKENAPVQGRKMKNCRRATKEFMLEQFVLRKKLEYDYSITFVQQIYSIIFIGLLLRTLTSSDFIYHSTGIDEITGFDFFPSCVYIRTDIWGTQTDSHRSHEQSSSDKFYTRIYSLHTSKSLSLHWKDCIKHLIQATCVTA